MNEKIEEMPKKKTLPQAVGFGTGTFLTFGAVDALAHLGPTGLVVGGIAAYIAAKHGPQIYDSVRSQIPDETVEQVKALLAKRPLVKETIDCALGRLDEAQEKPAVLNAPITPRLSVFSQEDLTSDVVEVEQALSPIFPDVPNDEKLCLGQVYATGQRFDPHINSLFGQGLIASAVQGSGKSTLCGLLIEQAGKCGVPTIIFDHKGEYATVLELPFVNGLLAGDASLYERTKLPFLALDASNADELVATTMREQRQTVVHLASYGESWLAKAEIIAEVLKSLMRWSAQQREVGGVLIPCLVFQDEAQLYIPQNVNLLPPEATKNRDVLDALSNAYFSLVSNGRSNGYTVCFATQSLTYIAKWAIKSCQIKVFMRHAEKNDLDMCETIINPRVATREQIESFPKGVGVVFGFTPQPMVVKFDRKQSRDESETPGIERLRAAQQRTFAKQSPVARTVTQEPTTKPELTLDDLLKLIRLMPDVDPEDSRYSSHYEEEEEYYERPVKVIRMPELPKRQEVPAKYARAFSAWNAGHKSIRKMMNELNIKFNEARELIEEMHEKGLIDKYDKGGEEEEYVS